MISSNGSVYINIKGGKSKAIKEDQIVPYISEQEKKLNELIQRSGFYIYEIASKLPLFSSFRDRLIISVNRITIVKRGLFYIDEYPMPLENITDAFVFTHLYFSSLTIETFGIPKPSPIKYLNPEEARLARRYILALIECRKANIDLSDLNPENVREKLKQIGRVNYGSLVDKYHRKLQV